LFTIHLIREIRVSIVAVLHIQAEELAKRFYEPAYRAARPLLKNEREARERSEAIVNLILARFAAGELDEEQTKRFEADDDKDTYVRSYLRKAAKRAPSPLRNDVGRAWRISARALIGPVTR
jgi:hypothetical protein